MGIAIAIGVVLMSLFAVTLALAGATVVTRFAQQMRDGEHA